MLTEAWDFTVGSEPYRRLAPGTFAHVRVTLDRRSDVTVGPLEPPAVARPVAAMASEQRAADQERAAPVGLPDPAGSGDGGGYQAPFGIIDSNQY